MTKMLCNRRIYHHVSCSQLFGFFPLGLCRRQPRNRQIHRQVCWKRHRISGVVGKERNIGFVGFLGNVEPKWCRKYGKWLCCEISQLNPDLRRVWPFGGIFCLTFFGEGCSPSRRAAPARFKCLASCLDNRVECDKIADIEPLFHVTCGVHRVLSLDLCYFDIVMAIGVRGGGSGGRPPPRAWNISGQAQVAQKSWIIKYISVQWKIPGQFCFQGKRKLLKHPE